MKWNRILLALIVSFSSCKKDKHEPLPTEPYKSYMPLAVGNYWIYQSVMIDTNGVETINPKLDSVYVSNDTLINGNVYYHIWGQTFLYSPSNNYYCRDSSGFMVTPGGNITFAANYYRDTMMIFVVPNFFVQFSYMMPNDTLITVPAGTFLTSVRQWEFVFTSSYQWDKLRYMPLYCSRGVGIVKERVFFTGTPKYWEGRLLRYHVQ